MVGAPDVVQARFRTMGTEAHVIVVGGAPQHLQLAEREIRARERRWSRFLPDSEVSRMNRAAGRPVVVSPDTFRVVADAVGAYRATGGRFDPTVLTSLEAAGYDRTFTEVTGSRGGPHVPAPTAEGIELHESVSIVVLPAGVGIDLGGIGKGAAADSVVACVLEAGAAGCCVNLGGDLRVAGTPPQAAGWVVELECPGSDGTRWVRLRSGAVCTSTTVQRRWRAGPGGRTEHHLRDPGSGAPLDTGLAAVTVVAARAAQAEVLTKVAFGAGPEGAAAALADAGVTGLLVLDDGTIRHLDGLDPFLTTPLEESDG